MRVVNLTSGARALFTAHTMWLDASRPGCQSWVKLPAGPDEVLQAGIKQQQMQLPPGGQLVPPGQQTCPVFGAELQLVPAPGAGRFKGWLHSSKTAQPGYSIAFHTSNIWGAGTGSKVFFELIGEHGSSGKFTSTHAAQAHVTSVSDFDTILWVLIRHEGQRTCSLFPGLCWNHHMMHQQQHHVHDTLMLSTASASHL